MMNLLQVTTFCLIAFFAGAAALAFNWLLLRAMFVLMRPAAVRRSAVTAPLVSGAQLVRAYETRR